MIHVGMDVHVRNSVLNACDAAGQVLARGRCGNTLLELATLLGPVERHVKQTGEPVRVVMESTTNSRAIRELLLRYGQEAEMDLSVDVLHARKVRVIAESVNKCDRIDTAILTDLSRSTLKLPVCYMPDDEEFALREHLRARSDLVRLRAMVKNRVHALLHRRGILTPTGDLFTRRGEEFLAQLELDEAGGTILGRFRSLIDRLDEAIGESDASLRALLRHARWARPAALLQSMPGIGPITALTILAELGDRTRFPSRAACSNYAGLVPRHRDSDQKHWSGGITRRGPCHLRAILIEGAWVAVRKVPVYQAMFERVACKGDRRTAVVAVARRMLEDAFTMLRKEQAFRYVRPDAGEKNRRPDPRIGPRAESSDAG